jgi:LysM repeat protein
MDIISFILFLILLIALIVGVVKPGLILWSRSEEKKTRKSVLKYYGIGMVLFLVLFTANACNYSLKKDSANKSANTSEQKAGADKKTASATKYAVKSGDTLNKIAAIYGATVLQIVSANNIENRNSIYVGQVLTIPLGANTPTPSIIKYTVRSGDTLNKIAAMYSVTVQEIVSSNNISNLSLINVGQVLTIPLSSEDKISAPILVTIKSLNKRIKLMSFDELEWITSDNTERLKEVGLKPEDLEGDFYIYNESNEIKSLRIADNASFYKLDGGSAILLPTDLNGLYDLIVKDKQNLYQIETKGDYIVNIVQTYTP